MSVPDHHVDFDAFFVKDARTLLLNSIASALEEDGPDFTTLAIFNPHKNITAKLIAKQNAIVAGLPIVPLIMDLTAEVINFKNLPQWTWTAKKQDGNHVANGEILGEVNGPAQLILRAERVILNYLTHLSGIATLTGQYVKKLQGSGIVLLDTRKTLPGLRYPEKYAVRVGGGRNHRCTLAEMLLLKNNHIDAVGGICPAVEKCREAYNPCPPIEVECRNFAEVQEALSCKVERIMLDNMGPQELNEALLSIPANVEVEISGGVKFEELHNLIDVSKRRPNFISVGRLTHSAPAADISLHFSY